MILILTCTISSGILLSFNMAETRETLYVDELDGQFDCILSSTIHLAFGQDNASRRYLTISSYLIEAPADASEPRSSGSEEGARAEISEVVDFYMARRTGWILQMSWDDNCTKEIASRNSQAVGGSDTYVIERAVPDLENGKRMIRLLMAG